MKGKSHPKKIKKWSEAEITKIINYITVYGNLEKPTAQIYYKRFLQISPIDATWDLIKWKVRYLRISFAKANQWRNSPEARELEADSENGISAVDDKLRKMCPHYTRLQTIFGQKLEEEMYEFDTNTTAAQRSEEDVGLYQSNTTTANLCNENTEEDVKLFDFNNGTADIYDEETVEKVDVLNEPLISDSIPAEAMQSSTHFATVAGIAKKLKRAALKSSIATLSRNQSERNETQRIRLKFEEYKFEKEFEFIKEKFKVEQAFRKQEIELKRMEIESKEKLRMIEMEKNERIAKYELDLKYNDAKAISTLSKVDLDAAHR